MRIGIVSQSYYPIRGGVAEHVYHTACELERRGHEVTIVTANFSRFDDDHGRQVIRIGRDVTVPYNGAFVNVTVSFDFQSVISQIESDRKFDIVHIHGPLEPLLPLYALRYFTCPKVGTFHSYSTGTPIGYVLLNKTLRSMASRLDARIAVSEAARGFISRFVPGQYDVIPNGVDIEQFSPNVVPMSWYDPSKEFTILFVGRLDPRKGLKYLIQAFSIVAQQLPRARLVVVGNGILRRYYEHFVTPNLRHRVSFVGFVSSRDLPRYYRSCDVFVSPAVGSESFGIVLIEALATGKAVVASDIVGYNSVVRNQQDGLLVEKRNPLAIAKAILEVAQRPDRRSELERAARKRGVEFAWSMVTSRIEAVYDRVLDQKRT